jgi:hypothetical protein
VSTVVYTTAGGRRFHADRACMALANGREYHAYASGYDAPLYALEPRVPRVAVQRGFTACRVCVPPALALPATSQTHGHEPWFVLLPDWRKGYGCARCRVRVRVPNMSRYDDPDDITGWHHETHAVPWPCTSAVVLGLATRGGTS